MSARPWGNQHASRKATLLNYLYRARLILSLGRVREARTVLAAWHILMRSVPASTRRRWRCGQ